AIVSGGNKGAGGAAVTPLRIILTGASSGIGAALTEALSADGHTLFVCARRSRGVHPHACDVTDEAQVEAFVQSLREQTSRVDVLINCAGSFGAIGPLEKQGGGE